MSLFKTIQRKLKQFRNTIKSMYFTIVEQDNYIKDETVTNEKVQEIIDNEHKIFETIQSNNVLFKDEQLNEEKIEKISETLIKKKELSKKEIISIIVHDKIMDDDEPVEPDVDQPNINRDFYTMFYRDFSTDIERNPNYAIWRCYHDEKLISQYNLTEDGIIKLFNTCNLGYKGKNLNLLTRFLSEGCCLLYPYLNNLKTDYIGFMHYRRWFNYDMNYLPIKLLEQNYMQYFHFHMPTDEITKHREEYGCEGFDYRTPYKDIENHCFFWSMDKCGIMDDLIEFLQTKYPQYLEGEKEIHDMIWVCMFVCKWEIYVELAKFLYDYVKFINDKYNLEWNDIKWYNHVYDKFLTYNQQHHPKTPDNIYCKRVEDDGSVWCELPFWGEQGWTTCPYEGYKTSIDTNSNLFRVYSYNIEFLTSVFIHNHKHYIDMNNVLYFINEDGTKERIKFQHEEY